MSDPITEAAATLATHPDPAVRLIAERLAEAKVRSAPGAGGDRAEQIAARDRLLRQLGTVHPMGTAHAAGTSRRPGIGSSTMKREIEAGTSVMRPTPEFVTSPG